MLNNSVRNIFDSKMILNVSKKKERKEIEREVGSVD